MIRGVFDVRRGWVIRLLRDRGAANAARVCPVVGALTRRPTLGDDAVQTLGRFDARAVTRAHEDAQAYSSAILAPSGRLAVFMSA
jgi:hypothetical protein